jgi:pentatricopeptide repeat protein
MKPFHRATLAALAIASVACAGHAAPALAHDHEDHEHVSVPPEKLGTVHFEITAAADEQKAFDRAVALLHSFEYEEAETAFRKIADSDPQGAMALWGIAMCNYHPIWGPTTQADFLRGKAASEKALQVGGKTDREKAYIEAIATYYRDDERLDFPTRKAAYETAMAGLHERFPNDMEGTIFYALAILGTAPTTDKSFAKQRKAADLLNSVLPKALDYPGLADLALPAARAYAKIAPSAPHAQHMPSHIFTRLGLWDESISSNLAAASTARAQMARTHPGATYFEELHAMDYLTYAYLQQGRFDKADEVLKSMRAVTKVNQETPSAAYSFAAVPARIALERHQWAEAAKLTDWPAWFSWSKFAWARALTQTARGIGAARSGDTEVARAALAQLDSLHQSLAGAEGYNWADQVDVQRREVAGWIAHAERRDAEALEKLTAAADLEDSIDKNPVTPGALIPAREQLGDLLIEMKKPADAVAAYKAVLQGAPGRRNALAGLETGTKEAAVGGPAQP